MDGDQRVPGGALAPGTGDAHGQLSPRGLSGKGRLQSDTASGKRSDTAAVHDTKQGGDEMRGEKYFSFKTRAQRVGKSCCTPNRNSWPSASGCELPGSGEF